MSTFSLTAFAPVPPFLAVNAVICITGVMVQEPEAHGWVDRAEAIGDACVAALERVAEQWKAGQ